jgi:hypothetical protein
MNLANSTLVHKHVQSDIKKLVHDLINKKYRFSFIPEKVIRMINGIEYYFIETEASDGAKYIINAYGSEALELFEEVHKCAICGKTIYRTDENTNLITYRADEERNMFVEPHCMSLLKKFEIAYGKEFFYH